MPPSRCWGSGSAGWVPSRALRAHSVAPSRPDPVRENLRRELRRDPQNRSTGQTVNICAVLARHFTGPGPTLIRVRAAGAGHPRGLRSPLLCSEAACRRGRPGLGPGPPGTVTGFQVAPPLVAPPSGRRRDAQWRDCTGPARCRPPRLPSRSATWKSRSAAGTSRSP